VALFTRIFGLGAFVRYSRRGVGFEAVFRDAGVSHGDTRVDICLQ
jgi:hypothetical protein